MSVITKAHNFRRLFKNAFSLLLLMTLVFACQKENTSQLDQQVVPQKEDAYSATQKVLQLAKQHRLVSVFDVEAIKRMYPNVSAARANKVANNAVSRLARNNDFQHYKALIEKAINPEDFECGSPTFLDFYLSSTIEDFTQEDLDLMFGWNIIPLIEAIEYDFTQGDDEFGINGEYTTSLLRTFLGLKRFWDIPKDIIMVNMKGSTFENEAVVSQIFQDFFIVGFDDNGAPIFAPKELADDFANFLKLAFSAPVFQNYTHPLFTFNAVAVPGNPATGFPNKIVMGDGVMEAYRANGFRTIADNFILAHEYGHQIQFANGYIPNDNSPETGRFIELMADAYAAYYMAHGRGGLEQPAMITQFVKTSFSIGDCSFDSPGHHGTHNQRAAAAAFGGKLAKRTGFIDTKLSSAEFYELFLEEYPNLIKPDAE